MMSKTTTWGNPSNIDAPGMTVRTFWCACGDFTGFRVMKFIGNGEPTEFFVQVLANNRHGFFRRVWDAIRRREHVIDEICLSDTDAEMFRLLLDRNEPEWRANA